ncbi:tautomerase family protein [Dysgonomonas macrotermitis]|uniref:Tautomerase enzyme n=1 Tax=Dysgonomonas macrotermitis TaxID=1346286 RepID=A0A1M5AZ59_9BACT|nr:tautomerase family protein [Dysgonomonas macrotermitis]SHF35518.1 Tautomerase enzyme [Dysgonomonas macrotermitis]
MPLIKIELKKGLDKQTLLSLKDTVMEAIICILQLPDDDKNIRLIEHEPDFFQLGSPYEILVEITLFSGRTKETKKELYKTIAENLTSIGIEKEKVFIVLNEQPAINWGLRGGIPADEINLNFKVDI